MASKKTTFKGFTFKKPGCQSHESSSERIKSGNIASHLNRGQQAMVTGPKSSIPPKIKIHSKSDSETSTGQANENFAKNSLQTSITSFARNKQVAVAAVIPQRSSAISQPQTKQAPVEKPKDSFVFNDTPIEIFDDDDDFEAPSYLQVPSNLSSRKPISKSSSRTADLSDSDEEIKRGNKRRRTANVIESDDGDEDDNKGKNASYLNRFTQNLFKSSETNDVDCRPQTDICTHPLLSKDISLMDEPDIITLKDVLLHVVDEVCDIVCQVRTGDLMDLVATNYERLQKLLSVRKQIKDLGMVFRSKTLNDNSSFQLTPVTRITKDNINMKGNFQSHLKLKHNLAMSTPTASSTSPTFPCVDSFFESPKTDFISGQTEGKHRYLIDSGKDCNSFICGQTKFSTPREVNSSHNNSFTDLFASQADKPIASTTSISEVVPKSSERHRETLDDVRDFDRALDVSAQSNQEIDDMDFSDEMEMAMMYDDEEYNHTVKIPSNKSVSYQQTYRHDGNRSLASHSEDDKSENFESFRIEEDGAPNTLDDNQLEEYTAVFGAGDLDDGASAEFAGMNFEHSTELMTMFRQVFGLKEFRHNQLPAINAALLGHDCFILMPTGGGKSLCYQLPALVTNGLSVIISPLRALIQDQTQRLLSLDVPASHLSSDIDTHQSQAIYSGLYQRVPAYKMLYVTPEKVSASEKLLSCFDSLFKRQLLTRFVIDEAHCVSQWGHDFRPDYKKLHVLRQRYPGVPMMALTATATPRVRKDIIHQLGMTSPKWFMQSFNRPNLKYTVRNKKPSTATADIIEIIKTKFRQDSGIVYCLSRKECDSVSADLCRAGIQSVPYHAGLDDTSRAQVQDRWLNDDSCKVICATIAFGMGIDKSDVRFVIHYSLPKSVEGYYQEAGRAGRDGVLSHCILLYSYQDAKRLRRMIETDQNATYESKRVHIDNLFRMISYCENVTDCRRCQVLQYFGESSFDRTMCAAISGAVCDNCQTKSSFSLRDVTMDAKEIVKCVKQINTGSCGNYTLIHMVEIFKGHSRLPLHGRGKDWTRSDVERLCRRLVIDQILKEDLIVNAQDHTLCYVKLGPKAMELMQGKIKVELAIQGGRRRADVAKIGSEPQNSREKLQMECLTELRALAKKIAREHNVKSYALIFPESALKQLAQFTPITKEEMIEQIDHFNATVVEKYQAHRLLDITIKYSMELAALEEDNDLDDDSHSMTSDGELASHYFEETSSTSRGRGRGFKRGSKRQFANKGRGRGGKKTASNGKKKANANKTSLGQFRFQSKNSGRGGIGGSGTFSGNKSFSNKEFKGQPATERNHSAGVSKTTLGLMPDPRSRSFLNPSFARGRGGIFF